MSATTSSVESENGAVESANSILTLLPILTGLRPCARQHVSGFEMYNSTLALPDLLATSRKCNTPPSEIFKATWATLLRAYSGAKDEIVFRCAHPAQHNGDQASAPTSTYCRLDAQTFGRSHLGDFVCHLRDTHCHEIQQPSENGDVDRREDTLDRNGTLLDITRILGLSEDYDEWRKGRGGPSDNAIGVRIEVVPLSTGRLSYNVRWLTDVLNKESAKLLLVQFDAISRGIICTPGASIDDICLQISSPLLSIANPEPQSLPPFSTLQSQIENSAIRDPQGIALEFWSNESSYEGRPAVSWTYGELNRRAETLARYLQQHSGKTARCVVPICLDRCPEIYVAVLAVLKVGAAFCPIDPAFPSRRRHDLIARTGATTLIVDDQSPKDGAPEGVALLNITGIEWSLEKHPDSVTITPYTDAYLIWTSGTTGLPKGVPITHQAAATSMRALQAYVPSDVKQGRVRCLQFSQFTFDVFVQDLFYTWGVGGTLISGDRATVLGSFADLVTKAKVTHAHLTPAFAVSVPRKTCPTLEVVTMIGEKLTQTVADDWSENCRLYNTYGPAEATVVSALRLVPHGDTVLSANIGYPLPSVSAFVLHEGQPVIKNGIGELALAGPQLSTGYLNDPKKTSERFIYDDRLKLVLYMTGDIVRQLSDGSLEFLGRTDDLVKIQGIRIELSEIAFALRSCHAKVQQVEVDFLSRPDRPSNVLVAFLAIPEPSRQSQELLVDGTSVEAAQSALKTSKEHLPDFMVPKVFLVVPTIPRTASAKVDRAALKRIYANSDIEIWEKTIRAIHENGQESKSLCPYSSLIIKIISHLTGTLESAITQQTTLQSIGVDSITATLLASKLQSEQHDVSLADILRSETVDDLLDRTSFSSTSAGRPTSTPLNIDLHNFLDSATAERAEVVLPAFPLQESLLSESLQNPMSYWSSTFYALDKKVDLCRLEACWREVARGTDAFRIGFLPIAALEQKPHVNAVFLQIIFKEARVDYETYPDTKADVIQQANSRLRGLAQRICKENFTEPPWAITIFLQEQHNIMMLSIHHSIRDESSVNFILKDLMQAYTGLSRPHQQRRHQLREAISRLYTDNARAQQDKQFWNDALSGFHGSNSNDSWPELKCTNEKPICGTVTYQCRSTMSYRELQALATVLGGTSIVSILRAVWGCILLEYLETDKVVFGETWSWRSESSMMVDMVGPLVTVLPVPFHSSGTLREIVLRHWKFQRQSNAHHTVHPQVIRRILDRSEHSPMYPAIFNFILPSQDQVHDDPDCLWDRMNLDLGINMEHALAFTASLASDGAVDFEFRAKSDYMDQVHLEILAKQFDTLVDLSSRFPDKEITQLLHRLPPELLSITPTEDSTPINLALCQSPTAWVDNHADLRPGAIAAEVVSDFQQNKITSKAWSYRDLRTAYRNVIRIINHARCAKEMIAVCLERRIEVYAVILGILQTGNVYVPVAEDLPADRKDFMIKDSTARMLFTSRSIDRDLSYDGGRCSTIFVEDIDYSKQVVVNGVDVCPSDNAYLLYTSGSTGIPKGVLVSRGNLTTFIESISDFIGSNVDMPPLWGKGKWLGMASLAFDVHLLEMFFAWKHGMSTVTAPRAMLLDDLEAALKRLKVTHASFVPSLVDNAGLDPNNLPDLRYMSVGGEKITRMVIDTWSRSHIVLANAYGPTETTIGCCFKKVGPDSNVRNVGKPLTHTVAHILRPGTVRYALRGTSGELCLTGDLVANGYHNRPDAAGFVKSFGRQRMRMYRTGDKARVMADGTLEFLGRDDDQTKIRGQRVELGEVSEAVRSAALKILNAEVIETSTLVLQHPKLSRPQLIAFVVVKDCRLVTNGHRTPKFLGGFDSDIAEQLRTYCKTTLPAFMIPDHIIRLSSMPLAPTSRKIDNKQLRSMFEAVPIVELTSCGSTISLPSPVATDIEEMIKRVISEALELNQASIHTTKSLFRLGLDSLNVISLAVKLQKNGVDITVSKILQNPTVQNIAIFARTDPPAPERSMAPSKASQMMVPAHDFCNIEQSNIAAVRSCLPLQESLIASSLGSEALYVNHVLLDLAPEVNEMKLVQAWTETTEEHEILRTCFQEFENRFVQIVLRKVNFRINRLRQETPQTLASESRSAYSQIATEIIADVDWKPPMRLALIDFNGNRRSLLISIHHALYDAESLSMILDEVDARYYSMPPKAHSPITKLLDYVGSQSQEESKAFWMKYLAGYVPKPLTLHHAITEKSVSANRCLSSPLNKIENVAASLNTTPSFMIQAIFGVTLAEKLEKQDVVFGCVLSGRTVPVENVHAVVAPCITTIPQRMKFDSPSLRDVVISNQKGFAESIDYQHTALKTIHRWVRASRPLFDVLFTYTQKRRKDSWSSLWRENEGSTLENKGSMLTGIPLSVEVVAHHMSDKVVAIYSVATNLCHPEVAQLVIQRLDDLIQALVQDNDIIIETVDRPDQDIVNRDAPSCHIWNESENRVRDAIVETLNVALADITKTTSFFTLGLDSIVAIRFTKRLRSLGIQCSSADVMRYPCVGELAEYVMSKNLAAVIDNQNETSSTRPRQQTEDLGCGVLMVYPCTPLQSAMLTSTLGSTRSLYVQQHAFHFGRDISKAKIERAWKHLVERTEILRTSFRFRMGDVSWEGVVHKQTETVINEHGSEATIDQVLTLIEKHRVFHDEADFASPPWAVDLLDDILILSLHHSLYDGESLSLMICEFSKLLAGSTPPVQVPFSATVGAIHETASEAEGYWLQTLQGFKGVPPASLGGRLRKARTTLKWNLGNIFEGCRRLGVTFQTIALMAYAKSLAWHSAQRDIIFGHVVRGRNLVTEGIDGIIGPLFNTIPLRLDLSEMGTTNKDLAQRIQSITGQSQRYQHASLSKIQRAWRNGVDDPEAELLDALFVLHIRPGDEEQPWTSVATDSDQAPTEYSTNFELEQTTTTVHAFLTSRTVGDPDAFLQVFQDAVQDIVQDPLKPASEFLEKSVSSEVGEPRQAVKADPENHPSPNPTSATLDTIRELLAETSGIPKANITDVASIFSLGLDSLSAIHIAALGRKKGFPVVVADILQGRTVTGIAERVEAAQNVSKANRMDNYLQASPPKDLLSLDPDPQGPVLAGLRGEDVETVVPCLPGQLFHLALWLKSGRTLGEATFTYACKERMDPNRVLNTWRSLRADHAILRTIFVATDPSTVVQVILKPTSIKSDSFQHIASPSSERDAIYQILQGEASNRFDLFCPPCKLLLIQGRDEDYVILRLHHALYDACTMTMLLKNLDSLLREVEPSELIDGESGLEAPLAANNSQDYWRNYLRGCQRTILGLTARKTDFGERDFHTLDRVICDLGWLETSCKQYDISLPAAILVAFGRTLAGQVPIPTPVFGLYQAGRSSHIEAHEKPTTPKLNVTPMVMRDIRKQAPKQNINRVQVDLADRVAFEQSYLNEIVYMTNSEDQPLFNTFINILWDNNAKDEAIEHEQLLLPWPIGDARNLPPRYRALGRTSIDALNTSFLADGNLFLNVQRDKAEDSLRLSLRCDHQVLSPKEASAFIATVVEEMQSCVSSCAE